MTGEVKLVEIRLPTRTTPQAHPVPEGTAVSHSAQMWAGRYPEGTARVVAHRGPWPDGSWEYEVLACQDFSRRPGPGNPMDRKTWWSSLAIRTYSIRADERD